MVTSGSMRVHQTLKGGVERLLLWGGVAHARRILLSGNVVVLAYHNIVPAGEVVAGDRPLHLPQRMFADQLDALLRTHEVIPLGSLFDPVRAEGARPRAVITFDDAYRGAMTAGVEELARRGLPATVFVAPAFVGRDTPFWWDSFSGPRGLDPAFRQHALAALHGDDQRVRTWARDRGREEMQVASHALCAGEEEIRAAVRTAGITLGAHTWSHVNLAAVGAGAHHSELVLPLAWLRERFDSVVSWLAYPYGLAGPAAREAAFQAGYVGALRVDGGWVPSHVRDPYDLPRLDVSSGISLEGFRLRASGFFC
jgi:peptidoglycan/xylan/chitin deacetylase (PgdA/CDA1 family)